MSERAERVSHASGAGITGAPASERVGGTGGAKPPGIDEDALRALVRETIARLDSRNATPHHHHDHRVHEPVPVLMHFSSHPSHYRYAMEPGGGPCQIEPGVTCQHCGYCESHGH